MAGIDVSSIVGGQNQSLANAQSQMASDFSQINQLSQQVTDATVASGKDDVAINSQQAQGLLAAQDAARQVAASYGGNPDDVSFIMNKLGAQWMDTEQQRLQALDVVKQKQSVSFMDDPLQWLSNKLTVNTDINQYNDLEEKSNTLYDQLEKINTLNTSTAQSMKAIAQTQTAATVAATTDLAAQKANIANANAKLQGILYNVKGIQDVTQLGQDQVDNTVKQAQTAIAAGHLQVAQAQLTVMQKEMNMKADFYQEEVKQKQQADQSDQAMLDSMNRGFAAMGLPPVDKIKGFNLLKAGGQPGEMAKQALSIGLMNDVTGKPIIAPTAGNAARILATSNSPIATTNPAVKPVTDLLQSEYLQARNPTNAQALGINPKDPTTLDAAVSSMVNGKLKVMASDIKTGDASNLYQAPPLASLATMNGFKQNPLYTKVLEPQIKTGMTETDPMQIAVLTRQAILDKQISLQDAVNGYASLFSHAIAMNNASKDFMRFGIAPQTSYVTDINGTGVFGGSTRVDLSNKAQVTTMFMKLINMQSAGQGSKLDEFFANF